MSNLANPPRIHAAVTPGPTELPFVANALYSGTGGNITVTIGGASVTYVGFPAGAYLLGEITHVTASDATGLVAIGPNSYR